MWGALKHLRGASEHRIMGVLRGTLDRGPLKHQIGSCIWDNVKDPIRSFRAPFVLRVYIGRRLATQRKITIKIHGHHQQKYQEECIGLRKSTLLTTRNGECSIQGYPLMSKSFQCEKRETCVSSTTPN